MKQYTALSLFTAPADNRLVIDYGCGGVGRKNKGVGHCSYACKKGWGMQYFDNILVKLSNVLTFVSITQVVD